MTTDGRTTIGILIAALCASAGIQPAFGQSAPVAAGPTLPATTPAVPTTRSGYFLGAGDKLRITVFGEENLTGEYAVTSEGIVSFPLIGNIPAANRSLGDVQEAIRAKLAAGYLRDPRVAVEVLEYRTFYILGEVNKPGEYPYRINLTLGQAIATAGGYTYRANHKRVAIRHSGSDVEERTRSKDPTGLPIRPGDTIRVLERFF